MKWDARESSVGILGAEEVDLVIRELKSQIDGATRIWGRFALPVVSESNREFETMGPLIRARSAKEIGTSHENGRASE